MAADHDREQFGLDYRLNRYAIKKGRDRGVERLRCAGPGAAAAPLPGGQRFTFDGKVAEWIDTKRPRDYELAVSLLRDLQAFADRQ